jgi:hypothetical protein
MDEWGRWTHYVEYVCPRTGVFSRDRCLGLRTAEVLAEQKRQFGFVRVQIVHRTNKHPRGVKSHVHDRRLY